MGDNSVNFTGSSFSGNFAQGNVTGNMEAKIASGNTGEFSNTQDVMELLSELKASLESDLNIKQSDKEQVLEQVEILEKAAQTPDNSNSVSNAQRASRMLRGIAGELPSATKFIEACSRLLPVISKTFGL